MLKAVLRLTAVFGLNTLIHCRLSSKKNMLLTFFAVNHSATSLGVNAVMKLLTMRFVPLH